MTKISILGIGRAGGALAIAVRRRGIDVGPLIHRASSPELAGFEPSDFARIEDINGIVADVLLIATPDQQIRSTAETLSAFEELPPVVLHLSGSLASDELDALRGREVSVGSMHPLVSISDPELGAERFAGSYFCLEGDAEAVRTAESIVSGLGGSHFSISTDLKPMYHASAVMASGNVTALFDAAIEMLSACGIEPSRAHQILLPLLQSTVANLNHRSTKDALTGPFVRGDNAALNRHLHAFDGNVTEDVRSIYLDLAERSVRLAAPANQDELLDSISMAKRKTGC